MVSHYAVFDYNWKIGKNFQLYGAIKFTLVGCFVSCTQRSEEDISSPTLNRLFHIGQLLPCYVLGVEGGSRVSLSTNPRLVNAHLTHRDIQPGMVSSRYVKKFQIFFSYMHTSIIVCHSWLLIVSNVHNSEFFLRWSKGGGRGSFKLCMLNVHVYTCT